MIINGIERQIEPKANLSGANLRWANLRWANLSWADLRGADLSEANLRGANLRGALCGADLRWANLRGADLREADLSGANLSGADLPSPQVILSASWGRISDSLCADLMFYDAESHPDSTLFDKWACGGGCPYSNVRVQRASNFVEARELWGKGKYCRPYDLMVRVLQEKCKGF